MIRRTGPGFCGVGGIPIASMGCSCPAAIYSYIAFDGASSYIDFGSDASIDWLWNGHARTIDLWACPDVLDPGQVMYFAEKGDHWSFGLVALNGSRYVYGRVEGDVTNATSLGRHTPDGLWHHYVMAYDDSGDRKVYFAVDGIWLAVYDQQDALTDNVIDDSADSLYVGSRAMIQWFLEGGIQWLRISSTLRYTPGVNFSAPTICAPPAVDGTTTELWTMDEGAGTSIVASINSPANNGTGANIAWGACS